MSTNASHTAATPAAAAATTPSKPTAKKAAQAIDSLTATLQASKLAEAGAAAFAQLSAAAIKQRLLNPHVAPSTTAAAAAVVETERIAEQVDEEAYAVAPALTTYIHDRVWAEGGEFVLRIASTPEEGVAFSAAELDVALANVAEAAKEVECQATTLIRLQHDTDSSADVMLRRTPNGAQELLELRVAVVGNVDAGKSSTLGVLTKGGLDDGRGKARVNLFRHKHEIESGRTSSVGMEIMGFDPKGNVVMNTDKGGSEASRKMSWEEVCARAAKIVSFLDLAGHERYLKTTVSGLTGGLADYVMLMVGANAGLIGMSKEHLGVALALSIPVLVCVTKVDMTPPHILEATIKQLTKILKSPGCRKTPIFVETQAQAVDCALRLQTERICPIFLISNVTGQNLDMLRSFLNVLPQANSSKFSPDEPFKFQLQDVFSVPFVGVVASGTIIAGKVRTGDNLLIGPDSLGQFTPTSVRSIHRKRVAVEAASAGQSASFALKRIRRSQVRKGMVMLSATLEPPKASLTCDAEILCLYHSTTLRIGSCMVLHAASIRQTVRIAAIAKLDASGAIVGTAFNDETKKDVEPPVVRTGDRALLRLALVKPEFLERGMRLITREGRTKLIGVIRDVGKTGPFESGVPTSPAPIATAQTAPTAVAATG